MREERKVLDGFIAEDARKQLQEIVDSGITPYRIRKETGVATVTIERILNGENPTAAQLDKLGVWVKKIKL